MNGPVIVLPPPPLPLPPPLLPPASDSFFIFETVSGRPGWS